MRWLLNYGLVTFLVLVGAGASAQQTAVKPEAALSEALSAACQQDETAFASSLTADNATAYRSLPAAQRTAIMKRFVLLEEPGRSLLSTTPEGRSVLRCETPSFDTEMRFGEVRLRENLAFIPMEIPIPGESPESITFGLVREGGGWKVLSVGLILLDIPAMAKQWEQADKQELENNAISDVRAVAAALEIYRRAYGKLPEALAALGPAKPEGISPEASGLLDAELAAGNKDGYTIRYTIVPIGGDLPEDETKKAEKFTLATTPNEYGKAGQRSFFLDSEGVLHGADKQGALANSTDPPVGPA
jgi:hypothetical protein